MGGIDGFIYWNDRLGDLYHFFYFVIGLLGFIALGLTFFLWWVYSKFKNRFYELDQNIQRIVEHTNTDPLTGFPTRELFMKNFQMILTKASRKQDKIALIFLDIDNFRKIKDSLGHTTGDALLELISQHLLQLTGNKKELLCRLGSDQFLIVLKNVSTHKYIENYLKKICELFSKPLLLNNHELMVTPSIGISLYPEDAKDTESLLKYSGIARYDAKKDPNSSFSFYKKEMDEKLAQQRSIETQLRNAIARHELYLLYQPKVDVLTRQIVGAEALLRWKNPILGEVSPIQFIPIAEQTGLINPIGNWVLREACLQTLNWHQQGFTDFSIAVNVSAEQLRSGDFIGRIGQVTVDTGLDPKKLQLELTESLIMDNVEKSLLIFKMLKTMGIQIAIDDFGTGYSSLSQLKRFPVDYLKIDQSFVTNITNETSDDKAIIMTIITLAKQLGVKLIAEGVETEEQFAFLKEAGCHMVQGYLFGSPLSIEDLTRLLKLNRPTSQASFDT